MLNPTPTVHAHRDNGVLVRGTRWEPRRVYCTVNPDHSDQPEREYIVKLRRGTPASAAANISELVCTMLFGSLGLKVLRCALVAVTEEMCRSYAESGDPEYNVDSGLHFGTVFDVDTESGPPDEATSVVDPYMLVEVWAADCWVMNRDRSNEGNVRLRPVLGGFELIAADQSDCFGGAKALADGSGLRQCHKLQAVPYPAVLVETMILEHGCRRLRTFVDRIAGSAALVKQAVGSVPEEWSSQAGVDPDEIIECLRLRAGRMAEILDIDKLEGIARLGGHEPHLL